MTSESKKISGSSISELYTNPTEYIFENSEEELEVTESDQSKRNTDLTTLLSKELSQLSSNLFKRIKVHTIQENSENKKQEEEHFIFESGRKSPDIAIQKSDIEIDEQIQSLIRYSKMNSNSISNSNLISKRHLYGRDAHWIGQRIEQNSSLELSQWGNTLKGVRELLYQPKNFFLSNDAKFNLNFWEDRKGAFPYAEVLEIFTSIFNNYLTYPACTLLTLKQFFAKVIENMLPETQRLEAKYAMIDQDFSDFVHFLSKTGKETLSKKYNKEELDELKSMLLNMRKKCSLWTSSYRGGLPGDLAQFEELIRETRSFYSCAFMIEKQKRDINNPIIQLPNPLTKDPLLFDKKDSSWTRDLNITLSFFDDYVLYLEASRVYLTELICSINITKNFISAGLEAIARSEQAIKV